MTNPKWDDTSRARIPPPARENPERVGIPARIFLYTIDQVAAMLEVSVKYVAVEFAHFEGRSIGMASDDRIVFRNIAPEGADPEWRCAEREFIRFLRRKGYIYYDRGHVTY